MTEHEEAPAHDPLSEEMDLITFQEADARLYKELVRTRDIVAGLQGSEDPDDRAEVTVQSERLRALEAVAQRLRGQRTQPTVTPTR